MQGPHTLRSALWALLAIVVFAATVLAQAQTDPGTPPAPEAAVSDQKAGSVLFYNLYTSSSSNCDSENTRINITNTNYSQSIAVHIFFVEGASCSPADSFLCLTPNQTMSFLAYDMDPGVMGFIVAVAVDRNGIPINFNYLIGDEFVKLASGHMANLGAEAFTAIQPNPAVVMNAEALLLFNDWHYVRAPRVLALDNIPSPGDGNNTILILNRFGGDLSTGGRWVGNIAGALYNDQENAFSFSFSGKCQVKQQLTNSFPRTAPNLSSVIQSGHSGWMRFWSTGAPDSTAVGIAAPGLLGAVLNCGEQSNPHVFRQGHNLHKLTFCDEGYFLPIIPPPC